MLFILFAASLNPMRMDQTFFEDREIEKTLNYCRWTQIEGKAQQRARDTLNAPITFAEFSRHFEKFKPSIFKAIASGSFELQPAHPIKLHIAGAQRRAYRFAWPDRFILIHLARIIAEHTSSSLSANLFSFRKGKSELQALKHVGNFIARHKRPTYLIRCDVKDYGNSMLHSELIADFKRLTNPSDALLKLFSSFCEFKFLEGSTEAKNLCGLPTGTHLQVVFENLYLSNLDNALEQFPVSVYARFGDDICFATLSHSTACSALQKMQSILAGRGLTPHQEKSANFVLSSPRPGLITAPAGSVNFKPAAYFDYLGKRLWYNGKIGLKNKKRRECLEFIDRHLRSLVSLREMPLDPEERAAILVACVRNLVQRSASGKVRHSPILSHLRAISEERDLRELDQWIALEIARHSLNKGHTRSVFRKVRIPFLRKIGLPSLIHLRHVGSL